jgi:hypothetical protein
VAAIGGYPEVITTIIVTHFDTDHYAGFLRLTERMSARGSCFRQLRLIAPRPPEEETTYAAQYFSLARTVTGIRNLDLVTALKRVTADNRFSYIPVSRNLHSQFLAAGLLFTVHWPPIGLPSRVAGEVRTAISRYQNLARKLRSEGNYVLDNNLRRARRAEWPSAESYNVEDVSEVAELPHQSYDTANLDFPADDDGEASDFPEIEALDLPGGLIGEFQAAWDAFRRANNNMSIVFDDQDKHSLAVFGDAGKSVLGWLTDHGNLAPQYDVMLAPHHGTQCLPEKFKVRAEVCISQNGSKRGYLWPRHVETHHNSSSCTTTQFGSHHIYIPRG